MTLLVIGIALTLSMVTSYPVDAYLYNGKSFNMGEIKRVMRQREFDECDTSSD